MKAIILDCEIIKAIHTEGEKLPGIEYVNGWGEATQAGVSVCAVWVDWLNLPRVFGKDNLDGLQPLIDEANFVVGFNNSTFDHPLLEANGIIIPRSKTFDIMAEWKRRTGKRVKLGDLCQANFGIGKTDDGAMAPIYWQRGEFFRVVDYCLADTVLLTLPLWRAVLAGGALRCPYTGRTVIIQPPALAASAE